MVRAKMTSKGQLTVPVEVRRRLDLKAGDEVLFDLDEKGTRLHVVKRKRLSDLYRVLPATKPYPGRDVLRREAAKEAARRLLERRRVR